MPAAEGRSFMVLPEKAQTIVNAGINLFELRKPGRGWHGTKDFGFWDVRVREDINPATQRLIYRKSWFKSHTAYIEYLPNKKGFLFGFAPDDEYWHNRLVLTGLVDATAATIIERYHTQDGTINGARLLAEIRIFRDYIDEWCVVSKGVVLFRSKSKEEARENAATHRGDELPVVERRRIKEVQALIDRFGGKWLLTSAFQTEIRPEIEKEIKALGSARTSAQHAGEQVVELLRNMSDRERQEVRKLLLGNAAAETAPEPAPEEGKALSELDYNTLRRIAKDKGINTNGLKKEEILEELTRAQKEEQQEEEALQETGNPYSGMIEEEEVT